MDTTIIYYTANREEENLERLVVETIKKNSGGREIVSVSQRPMDFGKNICVGVHDQCYYNEFRQIYIALMEVKTPYVLVTESDCLYPPDYFNFSPPEPGLNYKYNNVWVQYARRARTIYPFLFKGVAHCAQAVDRDMWLALIKEGLILDTEWARQEQGRRTKAMQFPNDSRLEWTGDPVITFKTYNGCRASTVVAPGHEPKDSLPYWGTAAEVKDKYIINNKT